MANKRMEEKGIESAHMMIEEVGEPGVCEWQRKTKREEKNTFQNEE